MPPLEVAMSQADMQARILFLEADIIAHTRSDGTRQSLPVEETNNIVTFIKQESFRIHKFVSAPKQHQTWALKIAAQMHPDTLAGDANRDAREEWAATYGDFALSKLNECRGYVISQIRAAASKLMDINYARDNALEAHLPSHADMKRVIMRDYDPNLVESEPLNELFAWYTRECLSKVAANATHWGLHKYCFDTISNTKLATNNNAFCIPPNAEAFVLIVYEGYSHVWQEQWRMKRKNPEADIHPPRFKKGEVPTEKQMKLLCHCTRIDNGQKKYGGWIKEQIEKFIVYRENVKTARMNANSPGIEHRAMELLRAKYNITQATFEEYEKSQKAGAKTPKAPIVEIENLFCDEE